MQKKWCDYGSCFERYTFERGPFAISGKELAEGLSKVLAASPAWELEDVLAPLRDNFIGALDIFDKVRGVSLAPLECRRRHVVEGRQVTVVQVTFVLGRWCGRQRGG